MKKIMFNDKCGLTAAVLEKGYPYAFEVPTGDEVRRYLNYKFN